MEDITPAARGLEPAQIEQFITDGFVRIDHAFPRELRERGSSDSLEGDGVRSG